MGKWLKSLYIISWTVALRSSRFRLPRKGGFCPRLRWKVLIAIMIVHPLKIKEPLPLEWEKKPPLYSKPTRLPQAATSYPRPSDKKQSLLASAEIRSKEDRFPKPLKIKICQGLVNIPFLLAFKLKIFIWN